jgi:transketolase
MTAGTFFLQLRFEAQGWEVLTVDGHDLDAITKAYRYAKSSDNGKPTLIICKTIIGKGVDEIAGTCAAHGEAGVKYRLTRTSPSRSAPHSSTTFLIWQVPGLSARVPRPPIAEVVRLAGDLRILRRR